jgi:hypothetical protein
MAKGQTRRYRADEGDSTNKSDTPNDQKCYEWASFLRQRLSWSHQRQGSIWHHDYPLDVAAHVPYSAVLEEISLGHCEDG